MRTRYVTHFALPVLLLTLTSHAYACRCTEPPVWKAYKGAAAVVMAKVVSTGPGNTPTATVIKAEIIESWKQGVSGTLNITTDTDCAYAVAVGKEYLLFLARDQAGNYSTGECMGNHSKATAPRAVAWLRKHGDAKTSEHQ